MRIKQINQDFSSYTVFFLTTFIFVILIFSSVSWFINFFNSHSCFVRSCFNFFASLTLSLCNFSFRSFLLGLNLSGVYLWVFFLWISKMIWLKQFIPEEFRYTRRHFQFWEVRMVWKISWTNLLKYYQVWWAFVIGTTEDRWKSWC